MADFNRNLKIAGAEANKVLTVGENGAFVSTNISVEDIGSKTELNTISNRVSALETATENISETLEDINGETIS